MSDKEDRALLEAELRARRDRTPPSLAKATWQMLLGEAEDGLSLLRTYYEQIPRERNRSQPLESLALLLGEPEAAAKEARASLEHTEQRWIPGWREYRRSMLALIAQDDEAARRHVGELDAYANRHERLSHGPAATIANIPRGLLAGDAERVATGLNAYLDWHLRSARSQSEKFNSAEGVIALDAIVALLVAHQRGLSVAVDARYRRALVPLLAVWLTHWEGRALDKGVKLSLESDLVAGRWLAARGLALADAPSGIGVRGGRREAAARRVGKAELEASVVVDHLRALLARGHGSTWQLISWAFITGDVNAARQQLAAGAARARRQWESMTPLNQNYVREHLALTLVAGDDKGFDEICRLLRAWMDAQHERLYEKVGPTLAYGHADGYVDFLADLLSASERQRIRADVETVNGPQGARTACVGLQRRDSTTFEQGLNDMLGEHVRTLERRTSPPPPLCAPAIYLAAAARRLGLPFQTDPAYAKHDVPFIIREPPGSRGEIGRLPCDLMGTALFQG